MNLAFWNLRLCLSLLLAGLLLGSGCSPNGYITASVQSVIGLDVSENPQTQVPHIRFGFVRNQLYYIPTGKVVVQGGPSGSGNAGETPHLVSDINADINFLSDTKITERFAVGRDAVTSTAAQYLFVPAVESSKKFAPIEVSPNLKPLQMEITKIVNDNPSKKTAAENWIKKNYPQYQGEKYIYTRFLLHPPSKAALESLLQELKKS